MELGCLMSQFDDDESKFHIFDISITSKYCWLRFLGGGMGKHIAATVLMGPILLIFEASFHLQSKAADLNNWKFIPHFGVSIFMKPSSSIGNQFYRNRSAHPSIFRPAHKLSSHLMTKLLIAFIIILILSLGRHILCAAAGRLQSRRYHKNLRMASSGGKLHVVSALIQLFRNVQFNLLPWPIVWLVWKSMSNANKTDWRQQHILAVCLAKYSIFIQLGGRWQQENCCRSKYEWHEARRRAKNRTEKKESGEQVEEGGKKNEWVVIIPTSLSIDSTVATMPLEALATIECTLHTVDSRFYEWEEILEKIDFVWMCAKWNLCQKHTNRTGNTRNFTKGSGKVVCSS